MSPTTELTCEHCAELEQRLEQTQISAEMDMAALGAQLARSQREIERLQRQVSDDKASHSAQDGEAYKHWLEVMGKDPAKCKFGESRKRALTRARRAGLKQPDVLKVISAHARYPFLVFGRWSANGSPKDRKDDLVDAFKAEGRWESLLALADAPVPKPPVTPRSITPRRNPDYPSYGYDRPVANLFAALEKADCRPFETASGQGSALCPCHDDRQKSFRFKESDSGSVLMYCQACSGSYYTNEAFCDEVRDMLAIPLTDLYPNQRS